MRKKIVAGNWKMFKTRADVTQFFQALTQLNEKTKLMPTSKAEVIICPAFTLLQTAADAARHTGVQVFAQNVHWEQEGAFTGEIAPAMLKDIGVPGAVVGHSERRQFFGDTSLSVAKRAANARKSGLIPIVCIGETRAEREAGKTQEVLKSQLTPVFECVDSCDRMIIAYEPVWAIGTGLTATNEQAQEAHAFIRQQCAQRYGAGAQDLRILYGGSVKPDNFSGLLAQRDIDGGLVGGASLKAEDFFKLVVTAVS